MTRLLAELKTRARLQLNAAKRATPPLDLRLRDCLHRVARDVGFAHWEHARRVLGGEATSGDDLGTFWHAPACSALLSGWFSKVDEARAALEAEPGSYLLPYRRQFVVAGSDFIVELGLDPDDAAWHDTRRDLVGAYGSDAWLALGFQRLKAPRSTFAAADGAFLRPGRAAY